jgi:divalent metal cation (Fe/Co/Zn/Cd) transporter
MPAPEPTPAARPAGPPAPAAAPPSPAAERWLRIGRRLVGATMAYNGVEAVLAVGAGVAARSIALVGFGLDSVIELAAASVLFWRLGLEARRVPPEVVERGERRVLRFVGGTFLALALYVVAQAGWMLWRRAAPEESPFGIALALVSLVVMPLVAWGKLRAAREVGSRALRAEAKETLACSYLSAALLAGLAANAALGWWWADPVAALLMVPWLVREGIEGLTGDPCDDD